MGGATTSLPLRGREPPSLQDQLKRSDRGQILRSYALILPAFILLLLAFVVPILILLTLSVRNPEVRTVLPETARAIQAWDGQGVPDDHIVAQFVDELRKAEAKGIAGIAAKRLNYDIVGFRSLLLEAARKLPATTSPKPLDDLAKIDPRWRDTATWVTIQRAAVPVTDRYLLSAFDLMRDAGGKITPVPENRAVFLDVLVRTFWISLGVTLICLALGYPLAYLLATLPTRQSNILMIFVLIPFYTSLLVRTTAWLVLLQEEGLVNDAAIDLGLFSHPLAMIHNRVGVYVAMVHILLPFMVFPIFSVMRGISPQYVRAAKSMGASTFLSFRRVYLPMTLPGVSAGSLLVFILSLGFYVTPALVGGPRDQFVSYYISYFTNQTLDWGMAAALSAVLLAIVLLLFAVFHRLGGVDRIKLG